ncbi:ribonuclease HII [Novosphingobium sp.]|uniref:ribonuclease HII n=1 Tax=Novosphingobium sp. TaxID=1874826 RepID=UPI003B51B352
MSCPSTIPATDLIIGVDEAGRGPLAGPVVAAAVVLGPGAPEGLADSKVLSAARRASLDPLIRQSCHWGIGVVDVEEIDRINIFAATMKAMTLAVASLVQARGACVVTLVLVDGHLTPAGRVAEWAWPARAIVGGDATERAISAASILAKQHRDALMHAAARDWPHYGWERNAGYGTPHHLAALRDHGPCPLHRRSFAPVRQALLI